MADVEEKCQPGCMVYHGGERKHRRDCVFYPESLTKLWHDTEDGYVTELNKLRAALFDIAEIGRIITNGDPAVLRNRAREAIGMEKQD